MTETVTNKKALIIDFILCVFFAILTTIGWMSYGFDIQHAPSLWYMILLTVYTVIRIICVSIVIGVGGYDD